MNARLTRLEIGENPNWIPEEIVYASWRLKGSLSKSLRSMFLISFAHRLSKRLRQETGSITTVARWMSCSHLKSPRCFVSVLSGSY